MVVQAVAEQREVDFLVAGRLSSHDDQELNSRLTGEGGGTLTSIRRWRTVTPLPTVFGASIQTAVFRGDDEKLTGCDCQR